MFLNSVLCVCIIPPSISMQLPRSRQPTSYKNIIPSRPYINSTIGVTKNWSLFSYFPYIHPSFPPSFLSLPSSLLILACHTYTRQPKPSYYARFPLRIFFFFLDAAPFQALLLETEYQWLRWCCCLYSMMFTIVSKMYSKVVATFLGTESVKRRIVNRV